MYQEILMFLNELPINVYGALLITYLATQIYYAVKEKINQRKLNNYYPELPFVSVLVPFYNEDLSEIDATIDSLVRLDYPEDKYEILVMDDGSALEDNYNKLKIKYEFHYNVKVFRQENMGKRKAQVNLSNLANNKAKYFLTVDSDTMFEPECLRELVKAATYFDVQAVSSGVMAKKQKNILNLLLRVRYWTANWQERLSQSWFNQVNCCSGPCSLWDAEMYKKVKEEYVSQTFFGKECTYGDDRHLTNLFIYYGGKIKMANYSVCYTTTPSTWKGWFRQQIRWSKSFYRETFWSFSNLGKKMGMFFKYQNTMAFFLPFVLVFNVFYYTLFSDPTGHTIMFYLVSIALAGLARGLYGFISTMDKTYFLAPAYGFVHFVIVFPIRVYALFRLSDNKWGTR